MSVTIIAFIQIDETSNVIKHNENNRSVQVSILH